MTSENVQITQTDKKYINAIFSITKAIENQLAQTGEIAKLLETKSSSVTEMILKLEVKGLIKYTKYKGVSLSNSGFEIALLNEKRKKGWEKFLIKNLFISANESDQLATKLATINSDSLHDRLINFQKEMSQLLIKPSTTNTHKPITFLANLKVNDLAQILGYASRERNFFEVVNSYQLYINAKVFVSYIDELADLVMITTEGGNNYTISLKLARKLIVSKL